MAGLLQGVRVLDLSAVIAGPLCSYQLALLGAEIIKVESPQGGDLSRRLGADPRMNSQLMGVSFLSNNAGKKSVTLDLKKPEAHDVIVDLLKTCDVVLENFRPGTMTRLNFDYEVARRIKPDIIWCSITGFGQTGPLAQRQAYDQIIQGLCGVMSLTGTPDTAPMRVGYQVCDTLSAITGSFAIAAALYRRQVSGEGEFIDLSMLDASITSMPSWPMSNYLNAGLAPKPMGNENGASAPSGTFQTKDGVINIVANDQKQFESLCDALDAPEIKSNPDFIDRPTRVRNREQLRVVLERKLSARSAREWDEILARYNVPAGLILSLPEILEHEHTVVRAIMKSFDADVIGIPFQVHKVGFHLSEHPADVDLAPPRLGQQTQEVLEALGYTDDKISILREKKVI